MLDKCKVVCTLTHEVEGHRVEVGREYEVLEHSIDKSKWYIIFHENVWVLFDKYCFAHTVTNYAVHKAYGDFHLPIIAKEGLMFVALTPTGYAVSLHQSDVAIGGYNVSQRIDCSEVRFR